MQISALLYKKYTYQWVINICQSEVSLVKAGNNLTAPTLVVQGVRPQQLVLDAKDLLSDKSFCPEYQPLEVWNHNKFTSFSC